MDRISGANFVTLALKRMWQDRNAQANVLQGTFGNALWFNGVQESILAPVEKVGLVPTDNDNTQLLQAIVAIQARGLFAYTAPGYFNWTVPQGWTDLHCLVIGGGAGGASGAGYAGYGGSSGGISWNCLQVAGGQAIAGYVGVGGGSDNNGGTSTFGQITSTGGQAGAQGSSAGPNPHAYGQIGQGQGTVAINGTFGDAPMSSNGFLIGGNGANSFFGGGGKGSYAAGTAGSPGQAPGAGGGGAAGNQQGGAGAPGIVIIWR